MPTEKELTGYPSVDKPWLKYYTKEAINAPLPECTMYKLLWENNKEHLGDISLNYYGRKFTYAQLFDGIEKATKAFSALGVQKGEIVIVCTVNTPEMVYALYALNRLGAVANMVDPRTNMDGIHEYILESDARYVMTVDLAYPAIVKAAKETAVERTIVVSPADSLPPVTKCLYQLKSKPQKLGDEALKWSEFISLGVDTVPEYAPYAKDTCCVMAHTGGTTGFPKAVMLSNDNINAVTHGYRYLGIPFERKHRYFNDLPPFIIANNLMQEGKGVLRLAPTWVPRSFCRPGKRIKLHPDDYYILGLERGGIDERWFASTTWAENGPGTPEDEGLSYVVSEDGTQRMLLRDVIDELKGAVIGDKLWEKYGKWPMFSKFFDNQGPLPHHIHHRNEHAARVGAAGKPEMYFFPAQCNNHGGEFPFTFFGFNPETTKAEVKESLESFTKGDNKLLDLSRAYKLVLDTGWDVPPGILHAPGSLCTYEPQFPSDVYAMYQSVLYGGQCVSEDLLWKNCPEEEKGNFDYLMDVIDWDANVDHDFRSKHFMAPKTIWNNESGCEEWVCYKCPLASAKRLTVKPGQSVRVKDMAAYGLIMLQGTGTLNQWALETPTLIRYGELTHDEYFVTEAAAKEGVLVTNTSNTEPLVMLKHFAENPELKLEA